MKRKILILCLALFSCVAFCLEVPPLKAHINDYAGIMNAMDERKAETYLSDLEATTGIQIALLTVSSLEGEILKILHTPLQKNGGWGRKKRITVRFYSLRFQSVKSELKLDTDLKTSSRMQKRG